MIICLICSSLIPGNNPDIVNFISNGLNLTSLDDASGVVLFSKVFLTSLFSVFVGKALAVIMGFVPPNFLFV